ncbi:GntR family transcriptional regulator [Frisingicoccus sp.]|uniref:GntR family transcriptional regulator n=1 Tax=Frisingicoccus sp. TaxID=1918627 RepID=UPI003AB1A505
MADLLKDIAYDKLRKMIAQGKFEYGKIYSLNALAAEMEMSRTPVRDAIQKLGEQRRIDIMASRGFRLHIMTQEEMEFHRHFSNAIECYCIQELTQDYMKDPGNVHVARMQHLLADMEKALTEDTPFAEYFILDQEFHAAIIDSLDNAYFSDLKKSPNGFFDHPELQLTDKKIARKVIYDLHKKILDAVCSGDVHGAVQAMIEHSDVMMSAF